MSAEEQRKRISTLIHKRGYVKAQLTNFKNVIETFIENVDRTRLRVRMDKLSETFTNFYDIQMELEILDPEADHASVHNEMTESYYDLLARAQDLLQSSASVPCDVNASPATVSNSASSLKLPEINIPIFDGSLERWLSFRDSFCSMIDRKPGLTGVDKLHYLRSFLSGEALDTIESLEMTDQNYNEAWQLLIDTYDNKRVIILRHSYLLLNLPSVSNGSSSGLRELINNSMQHLRSLKALGQPIEHWDTLLVTSVQSKLDNKTLREWESSLKNHCAPSFNDLITFLRKVASRLQSSVPSRTQTNNSNSKVATKQYANTPAQVRRKTLAVTVGKCPICTEAHSILNCRQFLELKIPDRIEIARKSFLCLNCLHSGHKTNQCQSPGRCHVCTKRHNSLLHLVTNLDKKGTSNQLELWLTTEPSRPKKSFNYVCDTLTQDLLVTAIVYAQNYKGHQIRCRTLLDTCSSTNFITDELATALNLPSESCSLPVETLNDSCTITTRIVTVCIQSCNGNYSRELKFLSVPRICQQVPGVQLDRKALNIPHNITLADPTFHKPGKVDMLLGSGITLSLFSVGQINLAPVNGPELLLQKTRLGWVIGGSLHVTPHKKPMCHATTIDFDFSKFWEIEEIMSKKHLSQEETLCENHFRKFTNRTPDGRYIVALPFRENISHLGNSRGIALKRLKGTERRLNRDKSLRYQYDHFLCEYLELNHMTRINDDTTTESGFYLPHHGVVKETSATTKLRVVFDGSAKSTTGISLNDTLLVGPTIQDDIFSLLIRFRTHAYVLTGDIEKMYRQILVRDEDRKYQKILYRDKCGQIATYNLNTVTYGLSSAPYLAIRCLHALVDDEGHKFPLAAHILKRDFYVDDLLTGADSREEIIQIKNELSQLLELGGFNIRKWSSNNLAAPTDLPMENVNTPLNLDNDKTAKTLGIVWNSQCDSISYTVNPVMTAATVTKRVILSEIAKIFDPLGLLGPVILRAKILMQHVWRSNIQWDESVPTEMYTEWNKFVSQLTCLVVKAMHLEIVSDLTTEAFMAALRRFIARRGKCRNIYSDNGLNFVGANAELKDITSLLQNQNKINGYLIENGIQWHFIPPHFPHFGGIWEAGIKS